MGWLSPLPEIMKFPHRVPIDSAMTRFVTTTTYPVIDQHDRVVKTSPAQSRILYPPEQQDQTPPPAEPPHPAEM